MSMLELKKLFEFDVSGGAVRPINAKPWSMADLWQRFSREAGETPASTGSDEGSGDGASSGDGDAPEGLKGKEAKPVDQSGQQSPPDAQDSPAASGSGLPPAEIRQVAPTQRMGPAPRMSFGESELIPLSALFEGSWGMSLTTEPLLDEGAVHETVQMMLPDPADSIGKLIFRHGVRRPGGEPSLMEAWEVESMNGDRFFAVLWNAAGETHGEVSSTEVSPEALWKAMEG